MKPRKAFINIDFFTFATEICIFECITYSKKKKKLEHFG